MSAARSLRHSVVRGRDDLPAMLALIGEARRSTAQSGYLHAGDLQWSLRVPADDGVHLWRDRNELAAFALIEPTGAVVLEVAPVHADARLALLEWIEDWLAARGAEEARLAAYEDDRLAQALRDRGYRALATFSYELVLDSPRTFDADLAPGFVMRSLQAAEDAAYVDLHRDAWSTWGPSSYTAELHATVTSMPGFRRDLVPLAVAHDGTLASYCIGWFDPHARSVEIEPLGTRPAFRERGLARAVVSELVGRSWGLGARSVMVRGASANLPALELYASCTFRRARVLRDFSRRLG